MAMFTRGQKKDLVNNCTYASLFNKYKKISDEELENLILDNENQEDINQHLSSLLDAKRENKEAKKSKKSKKNQKTKWDWFAKYMRKDLISLTPEG
jgi:hypothetical protein